MDEYQYLLTNAGLSCLYYFVDLFAGSDESFMLLKGIGKQLAFFVSGDGLFAGLLKVTCNSVVLTETKIVLCFDLALVVFVVLADETELKLLPKLKIDLVQSVDVIFESLQK